MSDPGLRLLLRQSARDLVIQALACHGEAEKLADDRTADREGLERAVYIVASAANQLRIRIGQLANLNSG